jgi:hypothetical protein
MKTLRYVLPLIALAGVLAAGCILVSAQVLASYDLPDPMIVSSAADVIDVDVDLNEIPEYADNKDKIKDISDLAFLGKFDNTGPAVNAEVWMTPGFTSWTTKGEITADPTAVKLWGPFSLAAGPSSKTITWSEAAALFTDAGEKLLIQEAKGDGQFTIYCVGAAGTYSFTVANGALALILEAGD